jgi:hypothetical protein
MPAMPSMANAERLVYTHLLMHRSLLEFIHFLLIIYFINNFQIISNILFIHKTVLNILKYAQPHLYNSELHLWITQIQK